MPIYRYELEAFCEMDVEAENQDEADKKAEETFNELFPSMFGGAEFKKEVE